MESKTLIALREGLRRPPVAGGMALALSLAAWDLLHVLFVSEAGVTPLSCLVPLFAALAVTTLVGFLLLWLLLRGIPGLHREGAERVLFGVSAGVATFLCLIELVGLFPAATDLAHPTPERTLFRMLAVTALSILAGVGAYTGMATLRPSSMVRRSIRAALYTLPLALIGGVVCVWNLAFRSRAVTLTASLPVWLAAAGLVILAFLFFHRRGTGNRPAYALGAVLAAALLGSVPERPFGPEGSVRENGDPSPDAPRHVLLLVADALRRDVLTCYGSTDVETPSIDRLAAEGTRFLDAISPAPWTLPAMASVMTGVSPLVHGVRSTADPLPSALTTLAEHLRNRGYHTGAIGSNPTLAPGSGMDQGFLEYHWFPRPKTEEFSIGASILRRVFPRTWQPDLTTRETTDRAIAWYRERRDANTFLWLHYIDPHIPYTPPPEYFPQGPRPAGISDISVRTARLGREVGRTVEERSWVRSLYEAEVRYVDHEIGRLLAALREMGLLDDMLIVFMSDHGEEFWDHEGFEHGHTMYQELLRVPLIVRPPGRPAPSEFGEVVSTECALPTILDLCRIPFDREGLTGTSLARIWDPGMPEVTERPVLSAAPLYFDDRLAVTSPDLKYIRSLVTEREMLYDRRTDEHEGSDIAQLRPDACRAARATLEQLQARMLRLHTTLLLNEAEAGFPDESMIGRLRSLGYVN